MTLSLRCDGQHVLGAVFGKGAHCRTSCLASAGVKPVPLLARIRRGDLTNAAFEDLVRLVLTLGFR
jgi:hypothetical protein